MTGITESAAATANVVVRVIDVATLRDHWPRWDRLPRSVRADLVARTPADRVSKHHNTTCVGLHEYLARVVDDDTNAADETASHFAVGTGDTEPAAGNTELNNEVFRNTIRESSVAGNAVEATAFLDTAEANGNTLVEFGLLSSDTGGSDLLWNHSLISEITKDDETTAEITATLTFNPA